MKSKSKKIILILIYILIFVFPTNAQYYTTEKTPQRIILNLTETPANSMAVTWRTIGKINQAEVQIAVATSWTDFEKNIITIKPISTEFITDKRFQVFQHSAIMDSLKPNELYIYRVGGDSVWSEWNQFRTAMEQTVPFEFVFFGDPQNDLKLHCSRVFREAFRTAPDAAFWLFSGDITSEPEDSQWEGFFDAGGFIFRVTPSILIPGNHDREFLWKDNKIVKDKRGKKLRSDSISKMFLEQLTLPKNGLPKFAETSYCLDYQGVRFIMINTNLEKTLTEQALWVEKLLSNNPNKWTVVSFHHPFYSAGRERDDVETRNAFLPIFDKYSVDLVLTGHDHAYSRSYKLKDNKKVNDNEKGTVYVVSVSGPKMYSVNSKYNHLMAKTAGNVQLFQVISINGNKLEYKAYAANGNLFDSFQLLKSEINLGAD